MEKIVFATHNLHKMEEIQDIVGDKIELMGLHELHCDEDIPETGNTLPDNALMKARYVWDKYGLPCFADDTGLEIEALDMAPGVHSARYAGEEKNSEANMQKVLRELQNKTNRKARFRTVIALILEGQEFLFEGIVNGCITEDKRGTGGFGYDPIFIPDGEIKTFAELGLAIKSQISHRALATNQLKEFLYERFPS